MASIMGGVAAHGFEKEGRHYGVCTTKQKCSAATIFIFPELMFGVYTLRWSRRMMLQTVKVGAQVGSPTIPGDHS